jgi:PKD repeat protein
MQSTRFAITQPVTIYLGADGTATVTAAQVDNNSTDNCAVVSWTLDKTNFVCSDAGENTVTLTVEDAAGNSNSATAIVTVVDAIDPVAITQPVTIYLGADGTATVTAAQVNNNSTDNCAVVSWTLDKTNFVCSDAGENTVTLTVEDAAGNSNSATAIVTVVDAIDPVAITQPVTIYLGADGTATVTAAQVNNGSTDNCAVVSWTLDKTNFVCSDAGENTVTLTVEDAAGNSNSATAIVTVVDAIDPVAITQPVTIYLGADGTATVTAAQVDNGSTDNCAVVSWTLDKTNFVCSDAGENTVTLTVEDAAGNSNSATAIVTVVDAIDPVAITQPVTIYLGADGTATVTAAQVDNGSTDNCAVVSWTLDKTNFVCSDAGENTVTLTVEDAAGNSNSATAIVTVVDAIDPVAITQPVTIYLGADGTATVTAAQVDNNSTDNCAVVSWTLDKTNFVCSDAGENTVTLTVEDAAGNSNSATAIVTVVDAIDPVAITQPVTIYLGADGTATVTAAQVDNGSTDNCAVVSWTLDKTNFVCSDAGENTVTLTVEDAAGNSNSATAIVTVVDAIDPVAITQPVTIYLGADGTATVTAAQVDNGSTDNCAVVSWTLDKTNFVCSDAGENTVTLTVEDAAGNSNSATAIVTVVDAIDPVAITQPVTIYLGADGTATVTAAQVDNGSTDNCAVVSWTLDKTNFVCSDAGENTVTLTVEDAAGNSNSATAIVTVVDAIDPVAITQPVTIYLGADGTATVTAAQVNNNSTDNCAVVSWTLDKTNFVCSDAGENTVTLTVEDAAGNSNSATAIVTVVDAIDPVAITQPVTIYLGADGTATVTAAQVNNNSTDNCAVVSWTLDKTNFVCSDAGENTVTLTVEDAAGNSNSATAIVTVVDAIDPVAITQPVTIYLGADGTATVTAAQVDNGSTDNCAVVSWTLDKTNFVCSDAGENTVTLTVEDAAGNSNSATAIVTVVDAIDPVAITQPVTIYLGADGTATVTAAQVDNGSTDNCAVVSWTLDKTNFVCSDAGENTVTLTVEDAAGNSNSATAIVTVVDAIDPVAITQPVTIYLGADGTATVTAAQVDNNSTDNCAVVSWTLDKTNFVCSDAGENTVTLTVEDAAGNSNSATAIVTVVDAIDPVAITQPVTIYLGADGTATVTAAQVDNGSTDNCAVVSWTLDKTNFVCSDAGENTVTLTVEDAAGNSNSATAIVTVVDAIDPVAITQPVTIYLGADGTATVTAAQVDNGSTDNCAVVSWTLDKTNFVCSDAGENTVTLTVEDAAGNSNSATAIVTVVDAIDPVAITQPVTIYLGADGTATVTAAQVDNNSTDNCAVVSWTLDKTNFVCSDAGENTVTLTVEDAAGNSNSATAIVTVVDAIDPVAITQPVTIYLGADGTATVTAAQVDNGSTDNCAVVSWTLDKTNFVCSDAGENTVTLTVEDAAGNSNSATAIVTVVDAIDPVAITQPVTIYLGADGTATVTAAQVDNGSTDNCAVVSWTLDKTNFVCSDAGENTVTLTVEDAAGNSNSATAIVTVVDAIDPVAITQPVTIYLGADGTATVTAAQVDNGSTDNCAVVSWTLDKTNFVCSDAGENTVTLTVEDASGNTDEATATITVVDEINPEITCVEDDSRFVDPYQTYYTVVGDEFDATATDACGVEFLTYEYNGNVSENFPSLDGLRLAVGSHTFVWTAVDFNGNDLNAPLLLLLRSVELPLCTLEIWKNNTQTRWIFSNTN